MTSDRTLKSVASMSLALLTSLSMAAVAESPISTAQAPALSAERQAFFGELHLHTGYSFAA
jgi:hypothetical protein